MGPPSHPVDFQVKWGFTYFDMGKSQRRKGHNFEREVAAELRACAPMIADRIRRGLQSRDGSTVPDVMTPWPIHVECKVGARPNVGAAMRQALAGAGPGQIPVVVTRRDRDPVGALVTVRWVDLRRMVSPPAMSPEGSGGTGSGVGEERVGEGESESEGEGA